MNCSAITCTGELKHGFVVGMMLRMFTYLYDQEIVDEEVFMKWKEDINEQYPGKGKALFQVRSAVLRCQT